VAYLDLPRLALTPEAFATQYVGSLLYWLGGSQGDPLAAGAGPRIESYFDPGFQLATVGRYGSKLLSDYQMLFYQALQRERPDQHLLLAMAFNWPEVWAQATGRRAMLLIDEFPELLALHNYPQIRDVLALFRAVLQAQSHVCYIVAGSMIGLMERGLRANWDWPRKVRCANCCKDLPARK